MACDGYVFDSKVEVVEQFCFLIGGWWLVAGGWELRVGSLELSARSLWLVADCLAMQALDGARNVCFFRK